MLTSTAASIDPAARRTFWFVYGLWAILTLQLLVFVVRYPHNGPLIDEWEFIPALMDEEPFWPWLWKLHNEHRFPLPRLIYYPLFKVTHDFRAGCYVSLLGISAFTLLMISTAKRLRGRLHFADAFFPITLLHTGHYENLVMGYQICFMMIAVFSGLLLRVIVLTDRTNLMRRGFEAGLATFLLLGCGAGGLAFAPFMAIWLIALVLWRLRARSHTEGRYLISLLILAVLMLVYIGLYLRGYARPEWHPDPVEVWGSHREAAWQSLRIALQALSMAFGPAAIGLWPVSALLICVIAFECALMLVRIIAFQIAERPRAAGLLLYLGAMAFMAMGIGWGRSGFLTADGRPGEMGLVSRYSWIMWPALAAIYFQWLIYGGKRFARWVPIVMFGIVTVMLPFNVATGFIEGEKHKAFSDEWEKSVRDGATDEQIIETYYSWCREEIRDRMRSSLYLLRKYRFNYYRPTPVAVPPPGQSRSLPRRDSRRSTGPFQRMPDR